MYSSLAILYLNSLLLYLKALKIKKKWVKIKNVNLIEKSVKPIFINGVINDKNINNNDAHSMLKIVYDEDGVEKSFAMQAGRDLRVIVKPEEMDELTSIKVARDIKDRIENEMQYPGTIRITVIRETRAIEEAR